MEQDRLVEERAENSVTESLHNAGCTAGANWAPACLPHLSKEAALQPAASFSVHCSNTGGVWHLVGLTDYVMCLDLVGRWLVIGISIV